MGSAKVDFDAKTMKRIERAIEKKDLEALIRLQNKGHFIPESMVPAEVFLQAADEGYSMYRFNNGTFYFHKDTETIIEDPESPWQGCCADQVPIEPIMYNGSRS